MKNKLNGWATTTTLVQTVRPLCDIVLFLRKHYFYYYYFIMIIIIVTFFDNNLGIVRITFGGHNILPAGAEQHASKRKQLREL